MELLHYGVVYLGPLARWARLMVARQRPFRPSRPDWGQAMLVAVALFAFYAATAPRTVALEDDGLFVLSSYFLGIEHPPGFPLFTLLAKLFTYLPWGSVAYRVHLASACFGALACAAAWLCARSLVEGRLGAYLAAFGLGLSPVFWSQSIIAEVYTLNTLFFLVLVYLGLRACPPGIAHASGDAAVLPWMALLFGLSLSNHWPLMLLVAPAFIVLLWPRRFEILRRLPLLFVLVGVGLLPYAWMVFLSWGGLPISFYGPIESFAEFWYFVSREGYAAVDVSVAATWLDRLKFFQFVGLQLLVQFAVLGTALAIAGFALQWRVFGTRVSAFLTIAFIMPTLVLLLLLGFEYDAMSKHVFHVYPLPAYAVVALWMGFGFVALVERLRLSDPQATGAAGVVLLLVLVVGSRSNLRAGDDWAARYARAVIASLPQKAILFVKSDLELGSIGYFHMIENWRPDLTLYQSQGLVLGNRLFHPLRTSPEGSQRVLRDFIDRQNGVIAFTSESFSGYARRDRWLYIEVDKSSRDPSRVTVDIPEEAVRFFEESVLEAEVANAWIAFHQNELRRRYGLLLGRSLSWGEPLDLRTKRHVEALSHDFHGALGLAEGLMANQRGYSAGVVYELLGRATELMPSDAPKTDQTRFFYLRGLLRLALDDKTGAARDLETAVEVWPSPENRALEPLRALYRETGNAAALNSLRGLARPHP